MYIIKSIHWITKVECLRTDLSDTVLTSETVTKISRFKMCHRHCANY